MQFTCAITVRYPDFTLQVDQELTLAGITAVMGASGSGKSTLLRCLAGLEPSVTGRVAVDGEVLQDTAAGVRVPPHRRRLGLVFQEARLFRHLTVGGNLRYAERRARGLKGNGADFPSVVQAFALKDLLSRRVTTLSGGERQRVAMARALLARPRLLLMDEPLAALDLKRKAELLPYIARLPQQFDIPVLYVSHAVEEVAQLADELLVLAEGRVVARGEVHDILERPEAEAVSGHFEAGVVLDGRVREQVPEFALSVVELGDQVLRMPMVDLPLGTAVRLRVRARDVAVARRPADAVSIRNQLRCRVLEIREEPPGPHADVLLALNGAHLRARITREAVHLLDLKPQDEVYALVKSVSFDRRALA